MAIMKGKSVIITGGAGDIARAAARRFLEAGASILLVDLNERGLKETVSALQSEAVRYRVADVTSEADTRGYVGHAVELFGTVDTLVANAGIEGEVAPVSEYDTAGFRKMMDINVTGVFLGIKHVFPVMSANGGGSIVITSSIAGVKGSSGVSAYNTSKHAVIGLMRSCAREGGEYNIRVNTVNPAPVEGRMMRSLEAGLMPETPDIVRDSMIETIPLNRYGRPEDVANLMFFLASDQARFISGGVYMVDGGMTA
jgi:NAD(P)-dependent dehydrogenase (short-subunit alcohol dehydrogenase family)